MSTGRRRRAAARPSRLSGGSLVAVVGGDMRGSWLASPVLARLRSADFERNDFRGNR